MTDPNKKSNLDDWKTVAYLSSAYTPFTERHADDISQMETAQTNGSLDDIMYKNVAQGWSQSIREGLNELETHKNDPSFDRATLKEMHKDLSKALATLKKITPTSSKSITPVQKIAPSLSSLVPRSAAAAGPVKNSSSDAALAPVKSSWFFPFQSKKQVYQPINPVRQISAQVCEDYDATVCKNNTSLAGALSDNEFYDMNAIALAYENKEIPINELRCCLQNVLISDDATVAAKTMQNILTQVGLVDKLGMYYNTRLEFILKYIPESFRRQIEVIQLLPRDDASLATMFIPYEYHALFPAQKHVVGVYTSDFAYMFRYVVTASDIWIPNFTTSPYFDNNQNRTLQFTDMPNIVHIKLTQILADEENAAESPSDSPISYNIYINNVPKLVGFDNATGLYFDTIRIHRAPVCKSIQNKLYAKNIDLRNIAAVHGLNVIVDESFTVINARTLKSLNIKLNKPDVTLKIVGVPQLETLVIKGMVNLGLSNRNVIFDHSTMKNLKTFILEGQLTAANARIVDNFVYELVRNNKGLSHMNIDGRSITGKDLYTRYLAVFSGSTQGAWSVGPTASRPNSKPERQRMAMFTPTTPV